MPKSCVTNVTEEELQKIQHLKKGEILSEGSIESIKKLLQLAQEIQKQIKLIIGSKSNIGSVSSLSAKTEAKKELTALITSLKEPSTEGGKSIYDIFSNLQSHLNQMISLGNKVLSLTTAIERQETKHSYFGFKTERKVLSKMSNLEKIEKKHIQANVHTLITINHYFKIVYNLMKKANDTLYKYERDSMVVGSYGRQGTRYRLQKLPDLKQHLHNASKFLESLIEALNKMLDLINDFGKYVKKATEATRQVLNYEEKITNEYTNIAV